MAAVISGSGLGLFNSSLSQIGRGLGGSARYGQGRDDQYVNIATGNLLLHSIDDQVVMRGMPLGFSRTYNSRGSFAAAGSDGWVSGFERRVELLGALNESGSVIRRHTGDGAYQEFALVGNNVYSSSAGGGAHDTLRYESGGWTYVEGGTRLEERYDSHATSGRLTAIRDPRSDPASPIVWDIAYNAAGRVSEVRASDGSGNVSRMAFTYSGHNLESVTSYSGAAAIGRVWYGYDAAGRLGSVTTDLSPGDSSHDLWTAPAGSNDGHLFRTVYAYTDASSLQIASIAQSDGSLVSYTYDALGRVLTLTRGDLNANDVDGQGQTLSFGYDPAGQSTRVTDSAGRAWVYFYDENNQLVAAQQPQDNGYSETYSYEYDADGNLTGAWIDGMAGSRYVYDSRGNQIEQREIVASGLSDITRVTERSFNANNQLSSETVYELRGGDVLGRAGPGERADDGRDGAAGKNFIPPDALITRYVYDAQNRLRFVVNAAGEVGETAYASAGFGIGRIGSQRQYLGELYTGAYTLAALEAWATTPRKGNSSLTDYRYDAFGSVSWRRYAGVDANGNGVAQDADLIEGYRYDERGRVLARTSASGADLRQTIYVYDGLGRLLSEKVFDRNAIALQSRSWAYTDSQRMATAIIEGGTVGDGDTGNDRVRIEQRNAAGQVVLVSENALSGPGQLRETRNLYDSAGLLRAVQDANGARSYLFYDVERQLVGEVDANGSLVEYVRDTFGRIIHTVRYATALDTRGWMPAPPAAPNLAQVPASIVALRPAATPQDRTVSTYYDLLDRKYAESDAEGRLTYYTYDFSNRLIRTRQLPAQGSQGDERVTRYFYDTMGRELGRLDAEGYLVEHSYDLAGNRTRSVAYASAVAAGLREGSLAQMRPAADGRDQITRWYYDGRGNALAMLDAEGHLTQYQRNERLLQDSTRAFEVKLVGLSGDESLAALLSLAQAGRVRETRRSYDAQGRLILQTDPEGTLTRNTYDAQGRLLRSETAADTSELREGRFRYNVFGELTGELDGEGAGRLAPGMSQAQIDVVFAQYGVRHGYDGLGRRIESIDAAGNKTWYFHDGGGRLTHSVRGQADANGVANARGEVSQTRYSAFGEAIETTAYTSVLVVAVPGDRNSVANALATLAYTAGSDSRRVYAYNRRGQLSSVSDAEASLRNYSYNGHGELTGEVSAAGSGAELRIDSRYDRRGLLTSRTEAPGSASQRQASWRYDAFGRVVSSTDARGAVRELGYDRLGREISRSQSVQGRVETATSVYDAYGRVLSETDASGRATRYEYDAVARSLQVTTAEGVVVTTLYNRHGQQLKVTQPLPGGASAVTEYRYDRNGRLLSLIDPSLNQARSEYDARGLLAASVDASGRRVELRYDAAGRVLQRIEDPQGLNLITRYQYDGQGRQLRVTDATGYLSEYRYDREGRLLESVRDPAGLNLRTVYGYDAQGRQVRVTEGAGTAQARSRRYDYDVLGRRIAEVVDPDGLQLTTRYVYDANDNLLRRYASDPAHTYRSYYDEANRRIYSVDPLGAIVRYRYDAAGREVASRAYLSPIATAGLDDATTIAQLDAMALPQAGDQGGFKVYDRDGRLRYEIDLQHRISERRYDAAGRLAAELSYANPVAPSAEQLQRLASGDIGAAEIAALVSASPGNDRLLRHVYDAAGRERYTLVQDGGATSILSERRYDASGRVIAEIAYGVRIPSNTAATEAAVTAALGVAGGGAQSRQTRHVYDRAGRLRYSVDDAGAVSAREYDASGRVLVLRQYQGLIGAATAMTEAAIEAAVAAMASRSTVTRYDDAGRVERVYDALFEAERYVYDASGLLVQMIDRNGQLWRYGYDGAGRRVTETSPPVTVASIDAAGQVSRSQRSIVTRTVYDALGQVIARVEDDATAQARHTYYEYDAAGRQVRTIFPAAGRIDPATGVLDFSGARPLTEVWYDALGRAVVHKDVLGRYSYKVYDERGRLLRDIDADGYVASYAYNGFGERGELLRHARKFDFSRLAGWVAGNAIGQAQSELGLVADARDRSLRTSYDQRGLAVRVEQALLGYQRDDGAIGQGRPTTQFEYDGYGRKVRESVLLQGTPGQADARWADSYFYYDDLGRLLLSVDAEGYLTRNEYYPTGELRQRTEFARALSSGGLSTATPPAPPAAGDEIVGFDRIVRWDYDALGRKEKEYVLRHYANPDGSSGVREVVAEFGYDGRDRLTRMVNDGVLTRTVYDALGRAVDLVEAGRQVLSANADAQLRLGADLGPGLLYEWSSPYTRMAYDAFGSVIETRRYASGDRGGSGPVADDARDQIERVRYDGQGRAVTVFSGAGAAADRTYIAYDALDRITERWSLLATASAVGGSLRVHETYAYDWRDPGNGATDPVLRKVRTTRVRETLAGVQVAIDVAETASFNAFGELVAKAYDGIAGNLGYDYDLAGRLVAGNETGTVRRYGYNLAGHRLSETRAVLGAGGVTDAVTRHGLDRLGRIVASESPAYSGDAQAVRPLTTRRLDRWGNALQIVDGRGFRSDYRYNESNQVTRDERPLVEVVSETGARQWLRPVNHWFYDALGQLIATRDANGNTRVNEYDAVGRMTGSIDALGQKTRFAFDALGHQRLTQNPLGYVTYKDYDALGRIVGIGDYLPTGQGGERSRNSLQRYLLNQNGDRIGQYDAYDHLIRYEYDSRHLLLRSQSATGAVVNYAYDGLARKVYEHNGIDPMSWAYDAYGRLTDHRNLGGRDQRNDYDPTTGQLIRENHSGGASLGVGNGVRVLSYYPDGRVKAVYEQGSQNPTYRYGYDAAGNRTVEEVDTVDASGRAVHTLTRTLYDSHNRIARVSTDELGSGGSVLKRVFDLSYSYDAAGNRRSVRASAGYGAGVDGVAVENTAPQLLQAPPPRSLRSGQTGEFSILFSEVFRDREHDPLSLGIARADGLAWPSWLQVSAPDANGRVRFLANPPAGTVQQIEIRLSATENRPNGLSNATSFLLWVGPNQAPALIDPAQAQFRIKAGQPWNHDLAAGDYFRDPDLGDVLRLDVDSLTPAANWLSASADGASLRLRAAAAPATPGDYTLRLRATDQGGRSVVKTVLIRVVASTAPTGPAELPPRSATIGRDFSWSTALSSVFSDADGDRLSVTATGLPGWMTLQQVGEPDPPQLRLSGRVPADAVAGRVHRISFTARDESGNLKTASLEVTLRAGNGDPYLTGAIDDAAMVVIRDGSYAPPALPAFADGDGDALTLRLTGLPPGLSFDPVSRLIGGSADAGTYWLMYSADDGRGGRASVSLRLVVRDNAPPSVPAFSVPAARQGADYLHVIPEAWDPDGPVSYWVNEQQLPPGLSFNPATRELRGRPTGQGEFTVTMSVWDRFGATTVTSFAMNVGAPAANQAPVPTTVPQLLEFEMSSSHSAPAPIQLPANLFVDPDGNPMSYTISGQPSWLSHVGNAQGHTFSADRSAWNSSGTRTFVLTADDGEGGIATLDIRVRVLRTTLLAEPEFESGPTAAVHGFEFDMGASSSEGTADGAVEPGVVSAAVPVETQEYWYTYDAENRLKINNGRLDAGRIVLNHAERESYELGYDGAGNIVARFSLRLAGPGATVPTLRVERSAFDLRGNRSLEFHQEVVGGGMDAYQGVRKSFAYDANRRLTETREYYSHSTVFNIGSAGEPEWIELGGWLSAAELQVYDADGRLMSLDTKGRPALDASWVRPAHNHHLDAQYRDLGVLQARTYVDYRINTGRGPNAPAADTYASGYDAAGRLIRYDYSPDASQSSIQRYSYAYYGWDSYQEKTVTGTRPYQPSQPATSNTLSYDSFGRLLSQREHTPLSSGSIEDRMRYYGYNGDGRVQTRREGLMRGGVFTQDGAGGPGNYLLVHGGGQQQAELRQGVQLPSGGNSRQIQSLGGRGYYDAGGGSVVAQAGETLRSLAQRVYGSDQLWYVLADANGLGDPDQELAAGTRLSAPNATIAGNDASTFRPYDPGAAIGSTAPGLPTIAAPPKNHCNAVAMVLVVVIAVVVSVVTYGALAAPASAAISGAAAGTVTTAGAVAAGAAAGAAGSLASQAVGSLAGVGSFSWRNVAAGAVTGAITAGLSQQFGAVGDLLEQGSYLKAAGVALGSAASGYAGQKAAGLDAGFSWRSIAASATGSLASAAAGGAVGLASPQDFVGQFASNLVEGVVSLHVRQAFGVGEGDYGRVAADAFGNALGGWVAAYAGAGAETLESRLSKSMLARQLRLDAEINRDTLLSVGADLDGHFAGLAASADQSLSADLALRASARADAAQWASDRFAATQADWVAVAAGRERLAATTFAAMAGPASAGAIAVDDLGPALDLRRPESIPGFYKDDSVVRRNLAEQIESARDADWLERASWYLGEHRGRVGEPEGLTEARRDLEDFAQAPEFMPLARVEEYYTRLIGHDSGQTRLPAEEAALLRRSLEQFNRYYLGDSPLPLSGPSEVELEARQHFGNSIGMGFLGLFGVPALVTRAVGGSEDSVEGALRTGAIMLDLAALKADGAFAPRALALQRGTTSRVYPEHDGLFAVDRNTMAQDLAARVLKSSGYKVNPSARNLSDLITPSGRIESKQKSGTYMYVIDRDGNILIGTRSGQRMPHPTLLGGENPKVLGAGIVDIRGGQIHSIDNASGHFKPGQGSLAAARQAFGKLPPGAFRKDFRGYLSFDPDPH